MNRIQEVSEPSEVKYKMLCVCVCVCTNGHLYVEKLIIFEFSKGTPESYQEVRLHCTQGEEVLPLHGINCERSLDLSI